MLYTLVKDFLIEVLFVKENKYNGNMIYNTLKKDIISLKLKPGESIKETEISKKLNVSRTPVREAFIKLATENLVKVTPKRGSYVSLISTSQILEGFFLRLNMEKAILLSACKTFPSEYLIRLKENLKIQKLLLETNQDYINFHKFDNLFHSIIYEGCGMKGIWDLIEQHCSHYHRLRVLWDSSIETVNLNKTVQGHEKIIELIELSKDKEIEAVVNSHIKTLVDTLDELKSNFPDFFEE